MNKDRIKILKAAAKQYKEKCASIRSEYQNTEDRTAKIHKEDEAFISFLLGFISALPEPKTKLNEKLKYFRVNQNGSFSFSDTYDESRGYIGTVNHE